MINKNIWQAYRCFRRSAFTDSKISEYLGAELSAMKEIPEGDVSFRTEVLLARHSIQSLVEVAQEALDSLDFFLASIPSRVLDDLKDVEIGLSRRVPNLDSVMKDLALNALRRYGSPRGYLNTLRLLWSGRLRAYDECTSILASSSESPASKAIRIAEKLGAVRSADRELLKHQIVEEIDPDLIAKQLTQYKEELEAKTQIGQSAFILNGSIKTLALKVSVAKPDIAKDFGILDPDSDVLPIIACLLAGGPGIGICVIAFLIAISSHNVEDPDEDDTSTGGDDGGTTG